MDDLEQEFGPLSSVTLDNTEESAPSPSPQNVRPFDNNNHKTSKAAPDKPALPAALPASQSSASSVNETVAVSTMTDLSERPLPKYIKRFGHRNEPAVTPVISQHFPIKDASENSPPSSPTSSVDIITEATARPSGARPPADDRLIDTASESSDAESDHLDTSDDAVAGHRQQSSNTDSVDSDPQKHDTDEAHMIDHTHEAPPKMDEAFAEKPVNSPLRSEASDEADENEEDEDDADDNDNGDYNPANNKFYAPSRMQTKALREDDRHSSAAEEITTLSELHQTIPQPSLHPKTESHEPREPTLRDPSKPPQSQLQRPSTNNLARKLQSWRQQDTERDNEFIATFEEQCRLQEDKKRLMIEVRDLRLKVEDNKGLMIENRDLRLKVANLMSIINSNNDLDQTNDTTSENPSLANVSRLDSPTGHHPNDLYGGDASFEYNADVPRPSFDGRSYASGANIPQKGPKWQNKADKQALRIGTRVDDWQEVSRKKNGGGHTRMNPRLNGPNLGTSNKSSPTTYRKALLHNAEGVRIDAPISKPREQSILKIGRMNDEQRFCHSDVRGRCHDANCSFRHASDYSLSIDESAALRLFFRRLRCTKLPNCRDGDCIFGHVCPHPAPCFKGSKCAWAAAHGIDRKPAQEAEELISTAVD